MPVTQSIDFRNPNEIVSQANPTRFNEILREHTYYKDGRAYTDDGFSAAIAAEYAANQAAYDEYSFMSANPNRGLTEYNFENYTGVNPGVTIDINKYGVNPELAAAQAQQADLAAYYRGQDANRWSVNPSDLAPVDTYTYDPATADIYTADPSGYFEPTRDQLGYANDMLAYATDLNGSHLGSAADLQYLAATGQAPSAADLALNRDANALFAQQMAMAARARGSSSSGLATMNAQNNAALGYAQLVNAADIARAQEMAAARQGYAQTGLGIRQQDFGAAGQAAQNANQMYQVNNAELGAGLQNAQSLNQGSQYNTAQRNTANQFNVGQMQSASAANSQMLADTLQGNRQAGMQTEAADRAAAGTYDQTYLNALEGNRQADIRGEETYQQAVGDISSILGNVYSGNANNRTQLEGIEMQVQQQKDAALLGAVGAAVGGIGSMVASDERMKHVGKKVDAADFSRITEHKWRYKDEHQDDEDTEWLGDEEMESGMAKDFPEDVVEEDENGNLKLNMVKVMLRSAGALGDVQRRLKEAGL